MARMISSLKLPAKKALCAANRILRRYDEKVFILGDGRSGTTWLMEILNFDNRYRVLWEPFWGFEFDPPLPQNSHFPFPDSPGLRNQLSRAFGGSYISRRVTNAFPRLLYRGLLVKDINSHLIIAKILEAVPDLRMVYIVRHPFAVAMSKELHSQTGRFDWLTKPSYFTKQSDRIRSTLVDQLDLLEEIERQNNPRLIRVAVWCILHTMVFIACRKTPFEFVLYEHMVSDPDTEVRDLFNRLGFGRRHSIYEDTVRLRFREKSRTTIGANSIKATRRGIPSWQEMWSDKDVEQGLDLLTAFELDYLYYDQHYPRLAARELQTRLGYDDRPI